MIKKILLIVLTNINLSGWCSNPRLELKKRDTPFADLTPTSPLAENLSSKKVCCLSTGFEIDTTTPSAAISMLTCPSSGTPHFMDMLANARLSPVTESRPLTPVPVPSFTPRPRPIFSINTTSLPKPEYRDIHADEFSPRSSFVHLALKKAANINLSDQDIKIYQRAKMTHIPQTNPFARHKYQNHLETYIEISSELLDRILKSKHCTPQIHDFASSQNVRILSATKSATDTHE